MARELTQSELGTIKRASRAVFDDVFQRLRGDFDLPSMEAGRIAQQCEAAVSAGLHYVYSDVLDD